MGITSCEKDIEVPQKDNAGTTSFIEDRNNPFFDDEAITTITNASIESSIPDWYKQYTKEYLQGQSILIANISSNLGVVCWNCAEIEMISAIGAQYAYFPVISTQSGTVSGLLITKFFDSEVITTYVADLSLLQAVTTNYWSQIFGFFNQKIQGQSPSKDGVFGSRMLACEESGATGFCICRTGESCGGISNCQQITCDGNGGGGGGEEEEDGSFPDPLESLDEFYEWLWGSAWWLGDGEGTLEGGGASNPGALNGKGFFNLSYFGGFNDYLIAGLVNDFKRRHDIYMSADQLYNQLLECGVDTYLEFKYDLFTSYQDLSDCIKNIILQNNILHLEEEDGFILTEEEIQEIYPDVMLYSGDFPAYKKTGLINYLKDLLGFSDEAEAWLGSLPRDFNYSVLIYEYLRDNEFSGQSLSTSKILLDLINETSATIINFSHFDWLLNQEDYLHELDDFMEPFDGDADPNEIVGTLLSISDENVSESTFIALIQGIDVYFDSPSDENSIEQLFYVFENNDIDFLAPVNSKAISAPPAPDDWEFPEIDEELWDPLDPTKFWGIAGPIKDALINQYPSQTERINKYFVCRVLGIALENMSLASLEVTQNTATITANGSSAIPDGMLHGWVLDGLLWYEQPVILEVKGRFSNSDPVFYYGFNSTQYTVYRNYIEQNTYLPYSTLSHGIYFILPHGVSLSDEIISLANNQNIPLYVSGVHSDKNDQNIARVGLPKLENINGLNRDELQFSFLSDSFFEWGMPRRLVKYNNLKLQAASLLIQEAADAFESSYLQNNDPIEDEECPD